MNADSSSPPGGGSLPASAVASWTERRDEYQRVAREMAPCARLAAKDHWCWRVAAAVLWLLSLGRFPQQVFLEQFATTLGPLQAYPRQWREIPLWLIVHEARHTVQCQRAGWLVPLLGWLGRPLRTWAGLLPMAAAYGVLPVPVGLCWGRMRLELDADAAAWRAALRNGWMTEHQVRRRAREFADAVSGGAYLWSWPRSWTRRAFAARAEREIERWRSEAEAGR